MIVVKERFDISDTGGGGDGGDGYGSVGGDALHSTVAVAASVCQGSSVTVAIIMTVVR